MLDADQRFDRYKAQSGRRSLTARQRRRLDHKIGHQSAGAAEVREEGSAARQKVRAAAKARRSGAQLPKPTR